MLRGGESQQALNFLDILDVRWRQGWRISGRDQPFYCVRSYAGIAFGDARTV